MLNQHTITNEAELSEAIKLSKAIDGLTFSSSKSISIYNKTISVARKTKEVTVQAGITLEELMNLVQACGWSIPCLPSRNKITVAAALAIGAHGTSGFVLSKYVSKFKVVLANGALKEFTDDNVEINAFRLSLGLLGVFSEITFRCENIAKLHVKEFTLKDAVWLNKLDDYRANSDYLKVYWLPHTNYGRLIKGNNVDEDFKLKRERVPSKIKHKIDRYFYQKIKKNLKFTKIANQILKKLYYTSKKEYTGSLYDVSVKKNSISKNTFIEWSLPYSKFQVFFAELKELLENKNNAVFVYGVVELCFLKKDTIWLSPACKEDVVTFKFIEKEFLRPEMEAAFEEVKGVFVKYGGMECWRENIKNSSLKTSILELEAFKKLRKQLDPTNKFLTKQFKEIIEK